jgi:hypothetical protein
MMQSKDNSPLDSDDAVKVEGPEASSESSNIADEIIAHATPKRARSVPRHKVVNVEGDDGDMMISKSDRISKDDSEVHLTNKMKFKSRVWRQSPTGKGDLSSRINSPLEKTVVSAKTMSTLSSSSSSIFKPLSSTTPSAERVLSLERLLGYHGGPAVFLYDSKMLLHASGRVIVAVDLDGVTTKSSESEATAVGFWRAFRNKSSSNRPVEGYHQAFIKGHKNKIGIIQVILSVPR